MCAANCNLICVSCALSLWSACNLYGSRCRLFRRVWCTVICRNCNLALAHEIDFFGLCVRAFPTWSSSSSDLLGRPVECLLFHTSSLSELLVPSPNACHQMVSHHTHVWIHAELENNFQNYWVFGLYPSYSILQTRKNNVSETGVLFTIVRTV
jgi:hypothetical protein